VSAAAAVFDHAIPSGGEYWHLYLDVAGQSPHSERALATLKDLSDNARALAQLSTGATR
jgi:hypothetical protein